MLLLEAPCKALLCHSVLNSVRYYSVHLHVITEERIAEQEKKQATDTLVSSPGTNIKGKCTSTANWSKHTCMYKHIRILQIA